jgi:hypothetical protein
MREPRTIPWAADEYIQIDGLQCVYTRQPDWTLLVHFPGCTSALLADLVHAGHKIVLPRRVREESPPTRPKPEPAPDSPGRRREAALREGDLPDVMADLFAQRLSAALDADATEPAQ